MKKILLLFSILFIIGSSIAQEIPVDPTVRIGTLSNGMKYYIKKNIKPEKKVELRLAINVGSILEDEDQKGLAHFMEHMNFNGTKNFPGNKLVDFLQSIGVKFGNHLNAYTSFDETVYMLPVPLDKPGNLDSGLLVMEDWAFNATLTDEEINKERGVVLEELRLGLGPDKRMLDKYLPKVLYQSQYAERLPIGDKKLLETFKPDVIRRFHKDWYRPDLIAIIVVGDINVDEVEAKIKTNFSKYQNPTNERERKVFEVPVHQETLVAIENDPDATNSRVQLVYKDLGMPTPTLTVNDYNSNLVKNLFTTMLNNRLQELVNSNTPPFTYGFSYHGGTWARTKEGFQSFAMTNDGKQLNALKVLMEESEKVKRYGFTQGELDRAKSEVISYMEESYNNRDKNESENFVHEYINNFLEKEPIPGIEWEYNQAKTYLPSVSLDQVNAIIKDMIRDNNRVVVVTGPKKENITYPSKEQVLALFDEVKVAKLEPYEDKAVIENLVEPFNPTGKIVKTESDSKLGTTTFTLNNGAKVTYKKTDFKEDEIVFSARSLGGSNMISDADYIKTQFAFEGLSEAGYNQYSKNDINKFLSGKQVSAEPFISTYYEGFSGNSTQKDFETLFQIVYNYFTVLNYDEASFNAFKEKNSAFTKNLLSNPQFYFSSELSKYLNQKNPRFISIVPMDAEWANTDYSLAYKKYKERFANAGDFHFYFVGNVDETKLKEYATKYLGSLPATKETEKVIDLGYRMLYEPANKVFKKGKDPKSMVSIAYRGETNYDAKEALAITALAEVATIKINEKLREKESGIYGGGARAGMDKLPFGSYYFIVKFPCGPENVDKLTQIALDEIDNFVKKGPEQKDLDKYKEGEINELNTDLKDNNFWLKTLSKYHINKGDKYEILNLEKNIKALTVQDLQAVAKKYLTKNKSIATLMPEDGWEANATKESASETSKAQ